MKRLALGLFTNFLCFIAIYFGCLNATEGNVELIYIVMAIALISFSEICLFPMAKVLFITLTPSGYRGFMMGFFMFGMSYSNLAAIFIAKFMSVPKEHTSNAIMSLEIYQHGFFNIAIFSVILMALFGAAYPFLKRIIYPTYR